MSDEKKEDEPGTTTAVGRVVMTCLDATKTKIDEDLELIAFPGGEDSKEDKKSREAALEQAGLGIRKTMWRRGPGG